MADAIIITSGYASEKVNHELPAGFIFVFQRENQLGLSSEWIESLDELARRVQEVNPRELICGTAKASADFDPDELIAYCRRRPALH